VKTSLQERLGYRTRRHGGTMNEYTRRDYFDAINELVEAVTKKYVDKVKAVCAGGSFARGDFVPGRSDIDLYIVVQGQKEEIQMSLQREALDVEKKHFENLKPYLDQVIDVSVTSLQEMQEGKSFLGAGFEYSNFIKEGKLLFGEDIKAFIPKPSEEEQKESARKYLAKVYEMISNQERTFKLLNWVPLRVLPRKSKERWTRQAFNLIFRSAAVFLGSNGVYVSSKEDIAYAFKRLVKKEEPCSIISSASSLWEKWKTEQLNDKETRQLLENSSKFVKELRSAQ
jgi:predicted nucleotidyltransferase